MTHNRSRQKMNTHGIKQTFEEKTKRPYGTTQTPKAKTQTATVKDRC